MEKKKTDFWNSMGRKELIKLLSCQQVLLFKKKKNDSKDRATGTKAEARKAGPKRVNSASMDPEGRRSSHRELFSDLEN